MATLTVHYETLVRALTDGPTDEDRRDFEAAVNESLDKYLEYVRGVVETSGHEFEIDYGQEWGPSLTVSSDVSHEDESDLDRIIEIIPHFWEWYN